MDRLTAEAATLRPRPTDTVRYSTLLAMRTLARRVAYLDDELDNLATVMRPLIHSRAELLGMYGVGCDVAAKLLVAAGDNPDRLRPKPPSPTSAASPRSRRPRARPAATGSTAVVTAKPTTPSMHRHHPDGVAPADQDYVARRRAEGKSTGEIVRILRVRRPRSLQAPPTPAPRQLTLPAPQWRSDPSNRPTPLHRLFLERSCRPPLRPPERPGRDLPGACPQPRVADRCPVQTAHP